MDKGHGFLLMLAKLLIITFFQRHVTAQNSISSYFRCLCGRHADINDGWEINKYKDAVLFCLQIVISSNKYIDKAGSYRFLFPWLRNGLLTSTGTYAKQKQFKTLNLFLVCLLIYFLFPLLLCLFPLLICIFSSSCN